MSRPGPAAAVPRGVAGAVATARRVRAGRGRRVRPLSDRVAEHSGPVFTLLRAVHPVVSAGSVVVVTRAADVRAVLADHEHFAVTHYAPKMAAVTGPFILGLDDTPLYRHDHAALRAAMPVQEAAAVGAQVLAAARARVALRPHRLDIVADLVEPVVEQVASAHLGVPGPDPATQLAWCRALFEHIFLDVSDTPLVRERALAAAGRLRPHVDAAVAARRALLATGQPGPDDVLGRLLAVRGQDGALRDLAVRHNLIGLLTGWLPTVSKAFTMVVEELLRRPEQLASAQAAARAGDLPTVQAHVLEALRFRPQTWALLRTCVQTATVATGTRHETVVPAGTRVLVATRSAMFDRRAVPRPGEYRLDRPASAYLHFGAGLHTCFGAALDAAQLPALAMALLEGDDLLRAGPLRWAGPFPSSLPVRTRAHRPHPARQTARPSVPPTARPPVPPAAQPSVPPAAQPARGAR